MAYRRVLQVNKKGGMQVCSGWLIVREQVKGNIQWPKAGDGSSGSRYTNSIPNYPLWQFWEDVGNRKNPPYVHCTHACLPETSNISIDCVDDERSAISAGVYRFLLSCNLKMVWSEAWARHASRVDSIEQRHYLVDSLSGQRLPPDIEAQLSGGRKRYRRDDL